MPLITLVVVLAVAGLLLWAISQIPMDAVVAKIIPVVVIVFLCLYLLSFLVSTFPPGFTFFPYRR